MAATNWESDFPEETFAYIVSGPYTFRSEETRRNYYSTPLNTDREKLKTHALRKTYCTVDRVRIATYKLVSVEEIELC